MLIFTESVPASVTIILAPDCVPDWPPDSVPVYLALFPFFLLKIASRFDVPSRSLPQLSPGWGHTPRGVASPTRWSVRGAPLALGSLQLEAEAELGIESRC